MPDLDAIQSRLATYQQSHLLDFWAELSPESQQQLADQIAAVDFDQIAELHSGDTDQPDWAELANRATPPPAMRLSDRESGSAGGLGVTPAEAIARGKQALDAGEVGVLLVAGGQGSRLGFDQPKGMYPIGPVSSATLLQIHLEKAVALAERHGKSVPVYLMTSPVTHEEQTKFLADNDRFGLAEDDLVIFCQGTMPAVDRETGKLLLAEKDRLFLSPDGHGGTVAALADASGQGRRTDRSYATPRHQTLVLPAGGQPDGPDRRRRVPRLPPAGRVGTHLDGRVESRSRRTSLATSA